MTMKRDREESTFLTLANCLVLLSQGQGEGRRRAGGSEEVVGEPSRVFECKTCSRQFPSFQALGGHRASHKKPRLAAGEEGLPQAQAPQSLAAAKPKTHECSVCGLEFKIGQALGGHMRRHKGASSVNRRSTPPMSTSLPADVGKKTEGASFLCLDLNLAPPENDLEFRMGKVAAAPVVHCFI